MGFYPGGNQRQSTQDLHGMDYVRDLFKQAENVKNWREKKMLKTQAQAELADFEFKRFKNVYSNIRISNPYRDMENEFEDLTINQPRANFERATLQQSQSNILNTLRRSTGAANISSVAQSLVEQGKIAKQRSVADINQQVNKNMLTSASKQMELERLASSGKNMEAEFTQQQMAKLMSVSQDQVFKYLDDELQIDADASKDAFDQWGTIFKGAMTAAGMGLGGSFGGGGGATPPPA